MLFKMVQRLYVWLPWPSCDFYLDVHPVRVLPYPLYIIRHEAHQRALASWKVCNILCSICSGNVQGFVFECGGCSFILCYLCALLPSKFTHRWDKHPFLLTYSPVENHMAGWVLLWDVWARSKPQTVVLSLCRLWPIVPYRMCWNFFQWFAFKCEVWGHSQGWQTLPPSFFRSMP